MVLGSLWWFRAWYEWMFRRRVHDGLPGVVEAKSSWYAPGIARI